MVSSASSFGLVMNWCNGSSVFFTMFAWSWPEAANSSTCCASRSNSSINDRFSLEKWEILLDFARETFDLTGSCVGTCYSVLFRHCKQEHEYRKETEGTSRSFRIFAVAGAPFIAFLSVQSALNML